MSWPADFRARLDSGALAPIYALTVDGSPVILTTADVAVSGGLGLTVAPWLDIGALTFGSAGVAPIEWTPEAGALQKYYEGIDALVDGIIESYQGKYGLLTNYKSYKNQSYKNKNQVLKYFTGLLNTIEEKRDCCDDSYIQNQIDTVQELAYSTMYKLKFLQ